MYMSPEQLRGEPLDHRSDIFSLGLVLYEMATGHRAFDGPTSSVIAAKILNENPVAPRVHRPELQPQIEHILLKALEKDPDFRYQSAADLRADLKRLRRGQSREPNLVEKHSDSEGSTKPQAGSVATLPPSDTDIFKALLKRHLFATLTIAAILAAAVFAGIAAWYSRSEGDAPVGSTAFPNLQIQPLTFSGDVRFASIAPDGKFVTFVRNDSLWVRQITATAGVRDIELVPKHTGRTYQHPTISPSGDHVDFVRLEGDTRELWRVPLLGGSPQKIAEDVWSAVGWSPDGRSFAFMRANLEKYVGSLIRANADGSNLQVLARREPPLVFSGAFQPGSPATRPSWNSDGTEIVVPG
jgi:hypothetical protein